MTIAIILLSVAVIFFLYSYLNVKKKFNQLVDEYISEQKIGYIENDTWTYTGEDVDPNNDNFKVRMYVTQLEEYTNGESKLRLDRVEVLHSPSGAGTDKIRSALIHRISNEFSSTWKTKDVEWLVTKDSIKELRKKKLQEIKKNIKH